MNLSLILNLGLFRLLFFCVSHNSTFLATRAKLKENNKLISLDRKQISELANSVTTLTGNITTSSKQASAKVLFDNAKLPEKWFKRIDVNSEISVEDQIKELTEEYAEIRQSAVTDEIENGNYTPQSQVKDRSEKEWLDIMNKEEGVGESSGVASLGIE